MRTMTTTRPAGTLKRRQMRRGRKARTDTRRVRRAKVRATAPSKRRRPRRSESSGTRSQSWTRRASAGPGASEHSRVRSLATSNQKVSH